MDGNDTFRSAAGHRASDPSIEEMLRRARDARLGDDDGTPPWQQSALAPFAEPPLAWLRRRVLSWRVSFVAGLLVGVLLMYLVGRAGVLASNVLPPSQPLAQSAPATTTTLPPPPTDTPLPAPTYTPLPTPTDVPTATPVPTVASPTTDEIVALAQDFYDNQSPAAGTYVLVEATAVEIQSQDATQLTACITYEYAAVATPDTVAGTNTRPFTLVLSSDGTWQVTQVGEAGSCSLG